MRGMLGERTRLMMMGVTVELGVKAKVRVRVKVRGRVRLMVRAGLIEGLGVSRTR